MIYRTDQQWTYEPQIRYSYQDCLTATQLTFFVLPQHVIWNSEITDYPSFVRTKSINFQSKLLVRFVLRWQFNIKELIQDKSEIGRNDGYHCLIDIAQLATFALQIIEMKPRQKKTATWSASKTTGIRKMEYIWREGSVFATSHLLCVRVVRRSAWTGGDAWKCDHRYASWSIAQPKLMFQRWFVGLNSALKAKIQIWLWLRAEKWNVEFQTMWLARFYDRFNCMSD